MLRQIHSVTNSVPPAILCRLVSALIISRVDYCIAALVGVSSTRLKRLQAVLNASARLLSGSSRYCTITPLLRDLSWLPIKSRIDCRLSILTFSCLHSRAPQYLSSELSCPTGHQRRLRSTNSGKCVQPLVRHPTLGGRSFVAAASQTWNSLPASLRVIDDLHVFKKQLKACYFKLCFT